MIQPKEAQEKSLNATVFYPPILLLIAVVLFSLYDNDSFLQGVTAANNWILENFGWLFT